MFRFQLPSTRRVLVPLCALGLSGLLGCNSLTPEDQARLDSFKYNSKRFLEEGRFARAEDQCRKGLELDPEDVSLHQVLGFALLQQGQSKQIEESIRVFERSVDQEDEFDFRNHLGLGTARFQYGRVLEEAVRKTGSDEGLAVDEKEQRIAAYSEARDAAYSGAEEELRAVLANPRSKDDLTAQSTLANLLAIQSRYDESAAVLRALTASIAGSIRVRNESMSKDTLPPERRALYDREIEALKSQQLSALTLLATVAAKSKRWEEVVSVYAQVESAGAMSPADWSNRARAYDELGATEAAIADYERFLRAAAVATDFTRHGDAITSAMRRIDELKSGKGKRPAPAPIPAVTTPPTTPEPIDSK
jgi:tetratricopeptide (TPR) repeat protein